MRIYLIRHGETDWNKEGRAQGREDIPLNARGRAQAEALAEAFAAVPIDRIVTSPLMRAVETGAVIARAKGLTSPADSPDQIEADLIERDYGILSGRQVSKENRSIFFTDSGIEGIEPVRSVADRMAKLLASYADRPYAQVLMVSHGAAINALLERLSGGAYGGAKTWLVNTCINILEAETAEDGRPTLRVLAYNLTAEAFLSYEK